MARTAVEFSIRQLGFGDDGAVLRLVNADRLPGQPLASQDMLAQALAGRSVIGGDWWAELADVTTEVAVTSDDRVLGVMSRAVRPRDNTSLILWLHAGEDPAVISALLDHAIRQSGNRPISAFPFATALGLGLEALPVRHRPATHAALVERGFASTDLWRYLWMKLQGMGQQRPTSGTDVTDVRRTLQIRENDRVVGEAMVGMPVQGIGVLWWIGLEPAARELDLDRALLGSALEFLWRIGAGEVILFVASADLDDPDLMALYEQAGFEEVDQLYGYRRDWSDSPADPR
jgi:ribosomal protein S18 acetylase RimI-like enzyme